MYDNQPVWTWPFGEDDEYSPDGYGDNADGWNEDWSAWDWYDYHQMPNINDLARWVQMCEAEKEEEAHLTVLE